MIGYDYDGVVSTGKYRVYPDDVIITGNTYHEQIMKNLYEMDIKARIYFPFDTRIKNNRIAVAVWKAEMINRLQCEKYYEDDIEQINILKECCRTCEIVRVI